MWKAACSQNHGTFLDVCLKIFLSTQSRIVDPCFDWRSKIKTGSVCRQKHTYTLACTTISLVHWRHIVVQKGKFSVRGGHSEHSNSAQSGLNSDVLIGKHPQNKSEWFHRKISSKQALVAVFSPSLGFGKQTTYRAATSRDHSLTAFADWRDGLFFCNQFAGMSLSSGVLPNATSALAIDLKKDSVKGSIVCLQFIGPQDLMELHGARFPTTPHRKRSKKRADEPSLAPSLKRCVPPRPNHTWSHKLVRIQLFCWFILLFCSYFLPPIQRCIAIAATLFTLLFLCWHFSTKATSLAHVTKEDGVSQAAKPMVTLLPPLWLVSPMDVIPSLVVTVPCLWIFTTPPPFRFERPWLFGQTFFFFFFGSARKVTRFVDFSQKYERKLFFLLNHEFPKLRGQESHWEKG